MSGWHFWNPLEWWTLPYPTADGHRRYRHRAKGLVMFAKTFSLPFEDFTALDALGLPSRIEVQVGKVQAEEEEMKQLSKHRT